MKKIFSILMIVCIILGLAACGTAGGKQENNQTTSDNSTIMPDGEKVPDATISVTIIEEETVPPPNYEEVPENKDYNYNEYKYSVIGGNLLDETSMTADVYFRNYKYRNWGAGNGLILLKSDNIMDANNELLAQAVLNNEKDFIATSSDSFSFASYLRDENKEEKEIKRHYIDSEYVWSAHKIVCSDGTIIYRLQTNGFHENPSRPFILYGKDFEMLREIANCVTIENWDYVTLK